MKIVDAFPTKAGAQAAAKNYKRLGVQYAQVKKVSEDGGRLKYGVYLGGRNSSQYV